MWVTTPHISDTPSLNLTDGRVVIFMLTSTTITLTRTFVILQVWELRGMSNLHLQHGVVKIGFNPSLQGSTLTFKVRTMEGRGKVLSAEVWYLDIRFQLY